MCSHKLFQNNRPSKTFCFELFNLNLKFFNFLFLGKYFGSTCRSTGMKFPLDMIPCFFGVEFEPVLTNCGFLHLYISVQCSISIPPDNVLGSYSTNSLQSIYVKILVFT